MGTESQPDAPQKISYNVDCPGIAETSERVSLAICTKSRFIPLLWSYPGDVSTFQSSAGQVLEVLYFDGKGG